MKNEYSLDYLLTQITKLGGTIFFPILAFEKPATVELAQELYNKKLPFVYLYRGNNPHHLEYSNGRIINKSGICVDIHLTQFDYDAYQQYFNYSLDEIVDWYIETANNYSSFLLSDKDYILTTEDQIKSSLSLNIPMVLDVNQFTSNNVALDFIIVIKNNSYKLYSYGYFNDNIYYNSPPLSDIEKQNIKILKLMVIL